MTDTNRTGAEDTAEFREAQDPFTGQTVKIRNDLVKRLRGLYASGPTLPNGEPEFGWRQMGRPAPIDLEAAIALEHSAAREKALREALNLMLACYGKPKRDEWPVQAAFDDALSVHQIARAALAGEK